MNAEWLLDVADLKVAYGTGQNAATALDGVSLRIAKGSTVGVVGESGSGKSTLARSLIGTLHLHGAEPTAGRIDFDGVDLLGIDPGERRTLQGRRIGYVPQDSLASLNPVARVGTQIAECFQVHHGLRRRAAHERAVELLDQVGIPEPRRRARDYPHQLSGGMRQRVTIAIAVALDPDLLIADEPTTALDATLQAQILELLGALQRDRNLAILLISHDLGAVADLADQVVVMYAGRVVERSATDAIFAGPSHPYASGLLAASPQMLSERPITPIPGTPPSMSDLPGGCAFHPRCELSEQRCREDVPELRSIGSGEVACHLAKSITNGA